MTPIHLVVVAAVVVLTVLAGLAFFLGQPRSALASIAREGMPTRAALDRAVG